MLPQNIVNLVESFNGHFNAEHPLSLQFRKIANEVLAEKLGRGYMGFGSGDIVSYNKRIISFLDSKAIFLWDKMKEIVRGSNHPFYPTMAADLKELLAESMKHYLQQSERAMETMRTENNCPVGYVLESREGLKRVVPRLYPEIELFCQIYSTEMNAKKPVQNIQTNVFNAPHNRAYQDSTDNSTNTVNSETLFKEMRKAIESQIEAGSKQVELLAAVNAMETSKGTPKFLPAYQNFMAAAANHVTTLGPYLAPLSKMITGG